MTVELLGRTERITVRRPRSSDRDAFLAAANASAELHARWVTLPLDEQHWHAYLARAAGDDVVAFLIARNRDDGLVAGGSLSQVFLGGSLSAVLGYWAFAGHTGEGYVSEGLTVVTSYAFDRLGLHRIEANVQPGNVASAAVVRRLGFRLEGHSPHFLQVDGAWRDHDRWALTVEDWPAQRSPRRSHQASRRR